MKFCHSLAMTQPINGPLRSMNCWSVHPTPPGGPTSCATLPAATRLLSVAFWKWPERMATSRQQDGTTGSMNGLPTINPTLNWSRGSCSPISRAVLGKACLIFGPAKASKNQRTPPCLWPTAFWESNYSVRSATSIHLINGRRTTLWISQVSLTRPF